MLSEFGRLIIKEKIENGKTENTKAQQDQTHSNTNCTQLYSNIICWNINRVTHKLAVDTVNYRSCCIFLIVSRPSSSPPPSPPSHPAQFWLQSGWRRSTGFPLISLYAAVSADIGGNIYAQQIILYLLIPLRGLFFWGQDWNKQIAVMMVIMFCDNFAVAFKMYHHDFKVFSLSIQRF